MLEIMDTLWKKKKKKKKKKKTSRYSCNEFAQMNPCTTSNNTYYVDGGGVGGRGVEERRTAGEKEKAVKI